MVDGICLIVVAVGMIINGIFVYGKEPTEIEKTGWAYGFLGKNGISICLILLGIIALLIGVFVVKNEAKKLKRK